MFIEMCRSDEDPIAGSTARLFNLPFAQRTHTRPNRYEYDTECDTEYDTRMMFTISVRTASSLAPRLVICLKSRS